MLMTLYHLVIPQNLVKNYCCYGNCYQFERVIILTDLIMDIVGGMCHIYVQVGDNGSWWRSLP